jgi:hypothetical protein
MAKLVTPIMLGLAAALVATPALALDLNSFRAQHDRLKPTPPARSSPPAASLAARFVKS